MPQWTETILAMSEEVKALSPILEAGTQELKKSDMLKRGMAGRIQVFKKVAKALDTPSTRIEELGGVFHSQLASVDEGIISTIEMILDDESEESATQREIFIDSIVSLASSADAGLGSLGQLLENMKPLENMSKDLRKTLKKMRSGLTKAYEGRLIMNEWVSLLESLNTKK
jgi:hypothetical protein